MTSELRLDVDGRIFEASTRTALLAITQRLRRVRDAVFWSYLIPPLGWFGRLDRLLLEQDSHTKAAENLRRHLERVEEIRAEVALQASERSERDG